MVHLEYNGSIREKLKDRGYSIVDGPYSVPFGLILKNGNSEEVIADIRRGENLVVLPRDENETEQVKTLKGILKKEEFRDEPYKH